MKKKTFFLFILLHMNFLIYFSSGLVGKYASKNPIFSFPFLVLYLCSLFLMFLYSIFWQQLLKKIPISIAYANKSVIIIWGLCSGYILFNEAITFKMLVGVVMIIIGIILASFSYD